MGSSSSRMPPLPPDQCPHASGRAGGFESCPAHLPIVIRPARATVPGLELTHEPLPLVTCCHLDVGLAGEGRFYPCCRLGTPEARRRFVRSRLGAWSFIGALTGAGRATRRAS
ncbi:MAG TPA: hypothetical protein VLW53_13120 [Candidatus Eisenbacteria bacterium]|nr:hypothetical protein [Candidatus Eisenbacteria bacterium]